MRIAFITYEYPPDASFGGIATYAEQAARMQAGRGHEVEVFASSAFRDEVVETDGVRVHWIREAGRHDFGTVAGYRFALRHGVAPFDVLEGPDYNADARKAVQLVPEVAFVLKMHTPSKLAIELNGAQSLKEEARFVYRQVRRYARMVLRRQMLPPMVLTTGQTRQPQSELEKCHAWEADLVAPPCRDLCDYARNEWGIPEERIRLTPHPYVPRPELMRLEPRAGGKTVGFVGRLERRKGIETVVRAIPLILKAEPEARFRLVGAAAPRPGSGQLYDEWVREQLGPLMGAVELPGRAELAEMPGVYEGMDICVFPSLWENFPNVCLEAMTAARAVVGSEAGGMREILDGGQAGVLVRPGEPDALAREVIALMGAPEERIRLGRVGRQRVTEAYNHEVIGAMMESVYGEAIDRKAALRRGAGGVVK